MKSIKKASISALLPIMLMAVLVGMPQGSVFAWEGDWGMDWGDTSYSGFDSYSYDSYEPYDSYSYDSYEPYDTYSYDSYEPYDTYSYDSFESYDTYSYDSFEPYQTYSSNPVFGGGSYGGGYGGYGGSSIGTSKPISYSYPKTPVTFAPPTYHAPASTPVSNIITTTSNNCVNNSCNNTYIDNSINNSLLNSGTIANSAIATGVNNVAAIYPIQTAPVQHPVTYVQPAYHPAPYCTISITNYSGSSYGQYAQNQLATVTWSSTNSTSGYISPTIGTVSGYGSMQVYPLSGQVYTMTVYGQGGTATCSTQPFYVAPVVTYQNPTPYVSLSQIPYTGLELSALGNAMYWLSLVTFAGAAAYLVLYFNGGALAVLGLGRSKTQIAMPKISVSHPVIAPVVAPVATHVAPKVEHAQPVLSPIQFASATARSTTDSMKIELKNGETPRIVINRA